MLRPALAALLLAGAASGQERPGDKAFDGGRSRPRRESSELAPFAAEGGSMNLCSPRALALTGLPLGLFTRDGRAACEPADASGPVGAFLALARPGAAGGGFGAPGLGSLYLEEARRDPAFREQLRRYYGRARRGGAAPGWAWALALEVSGGDPRRAMRLAAYCGHDDLSAPPLPQPRSAEEARAAFEAERGRLEARAGQESPAARPPAAREPSDVAANDRLDDRGRLAALRPEDFRERGEDACPRAGSAFRRGDALGAGAAPGATARRVYAGAALACEALSLGASRLLAEQLPANGAWVDRLLRLNREDPGPSRVRADALALLTDWDPQFPFPGDSFPPPPEGWTPARYAAAKKRLSALGEEWRRAVEEYALGARFGARVCSR